MDSAKRTPVEDVTTSRTRDNTHYQSTNPDPGVGGLLCQECAPDNPNRPPDCPQYPPEVCRLTTIHSTTRAPISTTKRVVLPNAVDGHNAAGSVVAELLPFLSLFCIILSHYIDF
ncbi:uncharacterized protein LOC133180755 [Saccostrea echinata]|uniref:uncharacterized protein LOC133180755 n=1 Tax=Saccostrea echinata TaxID=191078 RepID=UPI002A806954|nr:uncharacterized protein LOC133180755 [Saccostrea echinata]